VRARRGAHDSCQTYTRSGIEAVISTNTRKECARARTVSGVTRAWKTPRLDGSACCQSGSGAELFDREAGAAGEGPSSVLLTSRCGLGAGGVQVTVGFRWWRL
jgi:hypothetical protein